MPHPIYNEFDPELLKPSMAPVHLAFLDLFVGRHRRLVLFKENGFGSVTINESLVCFYVCAFFMTKRGGSREKSIVAHTGVARRTIRDSLDRLVALGLLERDKKKVYFPTTPLASIINEAYREAIPEIQRFVTAWRKAPYSTLR